MVGDEKLRLRQEAKQQIRQFFDAKRAALDSKGAFDFSPDNIIKHRFLTAMNGIARDAEIRAMSLADRGEDWQRALDEAQKRFEKLKKETVKALVPDKIVGAHNKEIAELISSL